MEKDFKKVIRRAERAGWTVKVKKKGFQLVPPDKNKEIVTIHGTPSDQRAFNNFLSQMRQSGYED
jgi:hypothetical protein